MEELGKGLGKLNPQKLVYRMYRICFVSVDQQQVNNDRGSKNLQVSCCYDLKKGQDTVSIEHSCLVNAGNTWSIDVKCRPKQMVVKSPSGQSDRWRSLKEVYPDAKIEHKHNDIEVTLPVLPEDIEIAAFGRPGKNDKKRMQMVVLAEQPRQEQNWKILIYLVDDTTTACKVLLHSLILFLYGFTPICVKCFRHPYPIGLIGLP